MHKAVYLENGRYKDIEAVDVNPNQKKKVIYYCEDCKIRVVHNKGNIKEESKPFFRRSPGKFHLDFCQYKRKVTLAEIEKEIGTLDNLYFGIKPPLVLQQKEANEQEILEVISNNNESAPKEKSPIKTKVNQLKKHQKNLLTVDDLFHEINDILQQEFPVRQKLMNRIIGKIYYPYKGYNLLLENYKNSSLRKYFYVAGFIHINQFINLKDANKNYAIFSKNKDQNIQVRIYPYDNELSKNLQNLTWDTKTKGKTSEFIGVKADVKEVIYEEDLTIIKLNIYEFDLNHYRKT